MLLTFKNLPSAKMFERLCITKKNIGNYSKHLHAQTF